MDSDFTEEEIHRYARHIVLNDVGGVGQKKLRAARVLLVGAGGLGSPLGMYLAAAGVGVVGLIDDDVVELSNLQRQIAHATSDIGRSKVESAAETLRALNPLVEVRPHRARLTAANVMDLIAGYDLIADGSDNFATRFLLNDACYLAGRTLVSAAALRFDGQVATFKAHLGAPHPCYRCIHGAPPPDGLIPSCSQGGILGAVAGQIGAVQATEILKEIMGIGEGLSGRLLIVDCLAPAWRVVRVPRDPGCPLCGTSATIEDLSHHDRNDRPARP